MCVCVIPRGGTPVARAKKVCVCVYVRVLVCARMRVCVCVCMRVCVEHSLSHRSAHNGLLIVHRVIPYGGDIACAGLCQITSLATCALRSHPLSQVVPDAAVHTVAFRVVARHPERWKRASIDTEFSFSKSLGAVCTHNVLSKGPDEIHVALEPCADHRERESVAFALAADETNCDRIRMWDRHPDVLFRTALVSDSSDSCMSTLWSKSISALAAAEAWHNSSHALELDLTVTDHSAIHGCLQQLRTSGAVVEEPREPPTRVAWKFTESGMSSIGCSMRLVGPRSALDPRYGVGLTEMTVYELLLHLQSDDWAYAYASSKKGNPPVALTLKGAVPKQVLLHHSDNLPCKGYLLALAHSAELGKVGAEETGRLT